LGEPRVFGVRRTPGQQQRRQRLTEKFRARLPFNQNRSREFLAKGRIYFFVGNLVVCAFITPDALSTIFMVVPVQLLMEICIQISAHWERKKRKEEAAAKLREK